MTLTHLEASLMTAQTPLTAITGSLLGTAVGDALGLPYEGLSRRRGARLWGLPDRHRFFFGHGMVSDDTEHTCMVAQSLIASGGHIEVFERHLARQLRYWLLCLPAGVGLATLRAIVRLWLGFGPHRSGVFSAGNGPAMRAPILGAAVDDPLELKELVRASSRLTHTDPEAEQGAFAVALAAQLARREVTVSPARYLSQLQSALGPDAAELLSLVTAVVHSVENAQPTPAFAESLGLDAGVTGYVFHTVPVALHAWLSHPRNFRGAVTSIICCGGDADSTAAIVGGIVGATVGREGIPAEWIEGLAEWPRSVRWMEQLSQQLAATRSGEVSLPISLPLWQVLPRNALFLLIVLFHGFRRLLPPY